FGVHISSAFTDSPRKTIVASVMYTVVTQMLNTFIYSLRNKEMKKAFRKIFRVWISPVLASQTASVVDVFPLVQTNGILILIDKKVQISKYISQPWHINLNIIHALFHTLMVLLLSFCTEVEIPHFFCELAQIIKLACSDNFINFLLVYTVSVLFFGIPVFGILLSYIQIVSSVLKMSSLGGKYKAFSTCGSHLSVVLLFYGTGFGVHISSAFTDSPRKTVVASVMYSVVTQMLNPFIYSLRNKEMKKAFGKIISRITSLL
ncbi:olfactory receptor 7G2-like protein, partial [Cricetulus griseus]